MTGDLKNYELPAKDIEKALASEEMPNIDETQF